MAQNPYSGMQGAGRPTAAGTPPPTFRPGAPPPTAPGVPGGFMTPRPGAVKKPMSNAPQAPGAGQLPLPGLQKSQQNLLTQMAPAGTVPPAAPPTPPPAAPAAPPPPGGSVAPGGTGSVAPGAVAPPGGGAPPPAGGPGPTTGQLTDPAEYYGVPPELRQQITGSFSELMGTQPFGEAEMAAMRANLQEEKQGGISAAERDMRANLAARGITPGSGLEAEAMAEIQRGAESTYAQEYRTQQAEAAEKNLAAKLGSTQAAAQWTQQLNQMGLDTESAKQNRELIAAQIQNMKAQAAAAGRAGQPLMIPVENPDGSVTEIDSRYLDLLLGL